MMEGKVLLQTQTQDVVVNWANAEEGVWIIRKGADHMADGVLELRFPYWVVELGVGLGSHGRLNVLPVHLPSTRPAQRQKQPRPGSQPSASNIPATWIPMQSNPIQPWAKETQQTRGPLSPNVGTETLSQPTPPASAHLSSYPLPPFFLSTTMMMTTVQAEKINNGQLTHVTLTDRRRGLWTQGGHRIVGWHGTGLKFLDFRLVSWRKRSEASWPNFNININKNHSLLSFWNSDFILIL
jgi:hypothetical protein